MTAERIEQSIDRWQAQHELLVPRDIRRKVIEGYFPMSERHCFAILDTIRAVRPERFAPLLHPETAASPTV